MNLTKVISMHEPTSADAAADLARIEVQAAMYKAQLGNGIAMLETNLEALFHYIENLGSHLVAIEAIIKELGSAHTLDAAAIRKSIRDRVTEGTAGGADPAKALEVAADLLRSVS